MATGNGYDWVFIDTSSTMWVVAQEAIRVATMVVIPARPGFRELAAVRETVNLASARNKPYAVVLQRRAAEARRQGGADGPGIARLPRQVRHSGLVRADQRPRGHRTRHAADAGEADAPSLAAAEITRLWTAIELSVDAVNAAYAWARSAQDHAA